MKHKDFQRLSKQYLLEYLPGFVNIRNLIVHEPMEHFLRGFCFERSDDPTAFYVWVFFQPLYVPSDFIYFDFGHRLNGRINWWSIEKHAEEDVMADVREQVQVDGLPFLERFHAPIDLVDQIDEFEAYPTNTHFRETYAYSLILVDAYDLAEQELKQLHAQCAPNPRNVEWVYDQMHRGDRVLAALKHNPMRAKRLLLEWRVQTLRDLKLKKFAVSISD